MDVGHKDNNPMNNDPSNLRNEDPSVNRKEPRLREVEQDPEIKDKKGTQPAKYYATDIAKSTKDKRAAHFAKKKSGPAPGDASAKTKPSKHTQKFKQMYGEILGKDADMGDYIDDFKKSDAPQFKGKSKEKRKDMAIAAYLDKNESLLDKVNLLLSEDGHTDVASMKGKVQVAMKALQKMQSELGKLGDEDDLPTWWTNKVSTAVSRIDDMSDYLDTQVEDYTHYPAQVKKDNLPADGWITGDPPQPIVFDGSDTKSILDKANKEVEKERGVKQKPMVEFYQLDEKIEGLVTKAKKSGMPYGILKKVYDRGMAAWKTGHRPGTTPQQWAFARVNSFTTKSSGTWGKADKDLAKQVNSSYKPEEVEIDEAMYHHVLKGKVVASGSKSDMMKLVKKNGATVHKGADSNYILNSPGAKVGDIKEETLDEKYDLYHKDFSSAMQHAYSYAKSKMGITVDPKEIDSKVATGPKKPTEGKTNKYMLKGKGGNLQIQVYNKGGSKPFELNMYKEENALIAAAVGYLSND